MQKKFFSAVILAAVLAAPGVALAGFGPKSLSKCDIYEWIGIQNVMACEGLPEE